MRKRIISLLLVFCLVFSLVPTTAFAVTDKQETSAELTNPFQDIKESDWFYDSVQYARVNGFFSGTSATTFDPDGTMTRGMFATVLARMAGVDAERYRGETSFDDVSADAYYAPYVAWAVKYGITAGTGDDKFSPDVLINRAQMATLFVRYFEAFDISYETGANITTVPADLDSVPDYAKDAVMKLWRQGLLVGDGVNFNPDGNAARAQAATLAERMDEVVETWYKEPGVESERVKIDPAEEQKPEEPKKPISSGGNSGGTTTTYYNVEFRMGAGQSAIENVKLPESKLYASGTKIDMLPTPYKQDYVFLGWYYDEAMAQAVGSGDAVTRNMTLYAKMSALTPVSELETPNYVTRADVLAGNYAFDVTGVDTISDAIKIINITAGNEVITSAGYTVEGTTVTVPLKAGQTYRIELLDDKAQFELGGEAQAASVRYLNLITAMAPVNNLKLDDGITYIAVNDENLTAMTGTALESVKSNTASAGLYNLSVAANGSSSVEEVSYTGTFTYTGKALKIGDTVAIYAGTRPDQRKAESDNVSRAANTDNDAVAYVEITRDNGNNNYTYKTAEAEDVLFTPDILPVSNTADQDGDSNNKSITVTKDTMDFSDDIYAEMGLDSQTTIDVGDFIAFYSGALNESMSAAAKAGYAKITSVTPSGDNYVIAYDVATEDEILAVMDLYSERTEAITLNDAEKTQIENDIKNQAIESGFIDEAAVYLTALALETDGFRELSEDLDMDLESYSITFADGTPLDEGDMMLMAGQTVKIKEKKIDPQVSFGRNVCKHFEGKDGILVGLNLELVIDIGGKAEIILSAAFTQEVMISVNARGGAVWKWKWIFPYIADYQLNANIDLGSYTGIGITATAKTVGEKDEEFNWKPATSNKAEQRIIDIGKEIKELMEQEEKFLQKNVVGGDDDDDDDGGVSGASLAEKYASMMEAAEDSWIEIFAVKIFEQEGNVDPFHVLCYGVKAQFVVKANLYVTIGMTFEYGIAKRYNFSVSLFKRTATTETIDLEESHYNFDFYVMGTIGIRAGVELEVAVGLFSLKLDSVGVCAEVGAYAQMWGYFYYHASWSKSEGKSSGASGALALEIGIYLTVSFKAQAFSSEKLTYQPTLYDNSWPLLTVGSIENVYDFAYEDDDPRLAMDIQAVNTFTVPSSLFDMNYMDMKSGELYGSGSEDEDGDGVPDEAPKNYDSEDAGTNEKHFTIEFSNPKFSYQASTNSITIDPKGSANETCDMTITWKGGALVFTSKPIQRTLKINWSNPANVRYISFDSKGGSAVPMISKSINAPIGALPTPTKVGYTFDKWYMANDTAFAPPETMLNDWRDAPYSSRDQKGITVYAKWNPNANTKFTVEHYVQELNGTYTKTDRVDTPTGYTDSTITNGSGTNSKMVTYLAPRTSGTDTATKPNVASNEENPKYTVDFTKYTPKAFAAGKTIAPDGSTVVKIYYDRKSYSVTFTYGDRESSDNQPLTYTAKYGATVYAPKLALGGYDFSSFSGLTDEQMKNGVTVADNTTYYATWTPSNDTPFRVEHYVQRITDDAYVLYGDNAIQSASGTTDTAINIDTYKLNETHLTYQYATVGGKTVGTGEGQVAATIGADGKTVVKLYYNRNSYTLTFDEKGGNAVDDITQRYGKTVTLPAPEKQGYTFAGWYTDDACTDLFAAADALTVTMPAENTTLYAGWTARTDTAYKVEHLLQNDTGTGYTLHDTENKTGTTGGQTAAVAKNYTDDGFMPGVYTDTLIAADGKTVVEIKYDRKTYNVSFNSNGGSEVAAQIGVLHGAKASKPSAPTKTGYDFVSWYKDSNLTDDWNFEVDTVTATTTLYAKWEPKSDTAYTVKHYKQALDGSYPEALTETENKTGGTNQQTAAAAKTYTGFTAPTSITQKTIAADGSTVVELYYTRNQYILTFDPANGTQTTASSVYFEAPISAPTSDPTKTGYTFGGWGTVANKMPEANTTYTAKWTANSYTVAFEKNAPDGVEVSGSMANQTFTYDQAKNLTANGFTLPANSGYTFVGWATTADGAKAYNDGQSVSNLTDVENGTVTLYAVWQQGESVQYTVNHYQQDITDDDFTLVETQKLNGVAGTLTDAKANSYTGFTAPTDIEQQTIAADGSTVVDIRYERIARTITFAETGDITIIPINARFGATVQAPTNPTKTGYTFTGWSPAVPAKMPAEDMTITAQWQINQYTITFNTDGGNEIAPITKDYETAISAPTNPTKTGYTFVKWLKNGAEATVPSKMPAENITLTALWQVNQYTITLKDVDDHTYQTITKNYGENVGTVADPTRTGYTFDRWSEEIPTTMPAENKTITASWTANTRTVTFNANEGTCSETSRQVTYDSTYGALPTPTRTGYTFDGWYLNDAAVTGITKVATDTNHTLTARWTPKNYTISYSLYSGSVATANPTSYTVESPEITLNNPTRTGYTFTGWTGSNGTTPQTSVTILTGSTENRTYAANWTPITYNITYVLNGNGDEDVTNTGNPANYTVESEKITFADPARDGYTFGGWYTDSGFTADSKVTEIPAGSTGDLTLYAKWAQNSFTVVYELGSTDYPLGENEEETINNPNSTTPPINTEITLQDPRRPGYTFLGWYREDANFNEENKVTKISATSTGTTITLYAKWAHPKYTLTFDLNLPTGWTYDHTLPGARTGYYGTRLYDVTNSPTITSASGKTADFRGWWTKKENGDWGEKLAYPYTIGEANVTYYAQWGGLVSWYSNRPSNSYYVENELELGRQVFNLDDPFPEPPIPRLTDKVTYEFDGWYDAQSGGNKIEIFPEKVDGIYNYYAHWRLKAQS